MKRKKFKFEYVILIVEALVIIAAGLFFTLYMSNPAFLNEEIVNIVFLVSIGLTAINTIFCIAYILFSDVRKEKNDLRIGSIIGDDVKEAYLFAKVGLIVVDEEGYVLWSSDLFSQNQINLIGKNIYQQIPGLTECINQEKDSFNKIVFNNVVYEVKYLKSTGLFIFKDVHEYEELAKYSKEQALCLGNVIIDNYDEFISSVDSTNGIIANVKNLLTEYFEKYGCFIRQYKDDGFLVVCNSASIQKMEEDQFSIIDEVRKIKSKDIVKPTLSIGFAADYSDINRLSEVSANTIDVAMSRGGDQVVISKFNSDLKFFGGKSEASLNNNRVKLRVISDSLLNIAKGSSNVVIMGHKDADMDAIGACLGLKAFCNSVNKDVKIVYDSKMAERKTRQAVSSVFSRDESNKIFVSSKASEDLVNNKTLLIIADVSKPDMTMNPKLIEKTEKIVVIDHHRRAQEFIENPTLFYIEPGSSSASEIVAQMIKYNSLKKEIPLNSNFATIMLSGIFLDSLYYKTKTSSFATFEASMILKEYGADNSLADELLKDEFEEYELIEKIVIDSTVPYYGVRLCKGAEDEIVEAVTLAKAANRAVSFKGINCAFVIGRTSEKEIKISARSNGNINVQILMEKMGGGGHFSMAAATLKETDINKVELNLIAVLDEFLDEARVKGEEK